MNESFALMPWPRRVTRTDTALELTEPEWSVQWLGVRTLRLARVVARCVERMARSGGAGARLEIDCAAASAPYPELDDDEAYLLEIDAEAAHLRAANEWGIIRGL